MQNEEFMTPKQSTQNPQPVEAEKHVCHRGRPKAKMVKGIIKDHEMYMGLFVDGYIDGDFCIGNQEEVNANELELAPLIEYLWSLQLFLTSKRTPMSISSLRKLAYEAWQKKEKVKHYQKHKKKPDDTNNKRGKNKK